MLTISQSVRLTKSPDGSVLLDVEHGTIFSLNPVATRIIELLEERESISSVLNQISREFRVSEEIVKQDMDEFLSTLQQHGLLNEYKAERQSVRGDI